MVLRQPATARGCILKDVARIEAGCAGYATASRLDGKDALGMGIQLAHRQRLARHGRAATWPRAAALLPEGVSFGVPYDSPRFVSISIEKVVHTLIEAVALVFVVMLLFLQNFVTR